MEGFGFLADGATVGSVEIVGCCLFSKSRSFTACFLQTVLHKQAWLTWYLRKLNNARAHGSLQGGNNCAIVLPGPRCTALPSLPERVQEFVAEEQFHFVTSGNDGLVCAVDEVILFDSTFVCFPQVHPGLQLPGPLCVLHHPGSSGILLLLPAHPGMNNQTDQDDLGQSARFNLIRHLRFSRFHYFTSCWLQTNSSYHHHLHHVFTICCFTSSADGFSSQLFDSCSSPFVWWVCK